MKDHKVRMIDLMDPAVREDIVKGKFKQLFLGLSKKEQMEFLLRKGFQEEWIDGLYLTQEDYKELAQSFGWFFGCHSKTHRLFDKANTGELVMEIVDAYNDLKVLDNLLPFFAYPDGRFDHRAIALFKTAGIKYAFVLGNKDAKPLKNPFYIHRYVVYPE